MNSNPSESKTTIMVKPYSLKELAEIYGVNWRTLKKWISPFESSLGIRQGRYYTINQVKIIFDKLGLPYLIETD